MTQPDRPAAAEEAALAAGEVLRAAFEGDGLEIESKAQNDFVTSADRAAESAILEVLERRCPQDQVLTEESGLVGGGAEFQWIIDPLDGTTNFLRGLPMYGVSVACRRGFELVVGVVLEPERDRLFAAELGSGARANGEAIEVSERSGLAGAYLATGFPFKARSGLDLYLEIFRQTFQSASAIRRCGAAALDLAYTASGVFDGFFEFRLSPWDIAAGALLITEAGGRVSDLDGGDRYLETGNVLAGGRGVQADLLAKIGVLAGEDKLDRTVPRATGAPRGAC